MTSIDLPALKSVGGQLYLNGLSSLQTLRLQALTTVGATADDGLSVQQCGKLQDLRMDALERVSGVIVIGLNDNLGSLHELPALVSAGGWLVANNPKLPQCEVNAIATRLGRKCDMCTGNDTAATCP